MNTLAIIFGSANTFDSAKIFEQIRAKAQDVRQFGNGVYLVHGGLSAQEWTRAFPGVIVADHLTASNVSDEVRTFLGTQAAA